MTVLLFCRLVKEWTEKAVKFTKELIYAASDMSFLPIFEDKYGQQFGELFLTIDETVVSLNDLLVQNIHAVYASEGTFRLKISEITK